jgi:hypothetical protein
MLNSLIGSSLMLTPARMLSGGRCDYGCAMPAPLRVLLALLIAAALAPAAAAEAKTVWLCKPGLSGDPCSPGLDTTRFSPVGEQLGIERVKRARPRRIDCFYAYPTVSDQKTFESDRAIDPELRSIALYQAARFRATAASTRPSTARSRSPGCSATPSRSQGPRTRTATCALRGASTCGTTTADAASC